MTTNQYYAKCQHCGGKVKPGNGNLSKDTTTGKWIVTHIDKCYTQNEFDTMCEAYAKDKAAILAAGYNGDICYQQFSDDYGWHYVDLLPNTPHSDLYHISAAHHINDKPGIVYCILTPII